MNKNFFAFVNSLKRGVFASAALFFMFFPAPSHAGYDLSYVGDQIEYEAKYEDTFVRLARAYNLGFTEMRAANPGVDPWVPGAGTDLILPARHLLPDAPRKGAVINLSEMRMYVYRDGDEAPYTFPLGVGREGLNTPVGSTTVVRKVEGPIWRPTARMRKEDPKLKPEVLPGPDNPMGTHALYLGWPTYAIHGTNRPFGIGRRVSSGCIRLYPEDIVKVYDLLPVGTRVTVVDQPIKVGWIDDRLYLEAHVNIDQSTEMEETGVVQAPKLKDADLARIIKAAGPYKDKIRWAAVRTAVRERKGYPIEIARMPANEVSAQENQEAPVETAPKVSKPNKEDIKNALHEIYGPEPQASGKYEEPSYKNADNKKSRGGQSLRLNN